VRTWFICDDRGHLVVSGQAVGQILPESSFTVSFYQGPIYWKIPPPPGGGEGKFQQMSFGGKNMKRQREKGRKCKRKRKKGERKRKKGERKWEKGKLKGKIIAK
jgi:hypothetical protein